MAKTQVDKPTRTDVQRLLRDLFMTYREYRTPAMRALSEEIEEFRQRLLNNQKFKLMLRRLHAMENALHRKNVTGTELVAKVQRLFRANGLTPEVQRQVTALAKRANAGK